jgi:hypothetical protein
MPCGRRDTALRLVHSECRTFPLGGVALAVWDAAPQMSSYIVEAVVGSTLEDGFQMKMALPWMETIDQDLLLEEHHVQTIPAYWATGSDHHHALANSVDCQMERRERRIHLSE